MTTTTVTTAAEVAPRTEILVRVDRRRAVIIEPAAASERHGADVEWVRVFDVFTARGTTSITTPYGVWLTAPAAEVHTRAEQARR